MKNGPGTHYVFDRDNEKWDYKGVKTLEGIWENNILIFAKIEYCDGRLY